MASAARRAEGRESAASAECRTNLKQIGIALHKLSDRQKFLLP